MEAIKVNTPAEQLEGQFLKNDWTVTRKLARKPGSTGGFFSVGYHVENKNGTKAYLKALDFTKAFAHVDPARALQEMTTAFNFERDLLDHCKSRNMSRVVTGVDEGSVSIDFNGKKESVLYLIFELAKTDLRHEITTQPNMDISYILRVLHQVCIGLNQLHSADIVHQDLKPSNVLVFDNVGSKIGDLGRASSNQIAAPHDNVEFAGDRGYAPLELLYGEVNSDSSIRRFGCDAYLFGSLIFQMATGVSPTSYVLSTLQTPLHPINWGGTYRQALPHIQSAFSDSVVFLQAQLPDLLKSELVTAYTQLCEPDPLRRGHPKNHAQLGNSYRLQRYTSLLDLLATKAEFEFRRRTIK